MAQFTAAASAARTATTTFGPFYKQQCTAATVALIVSAAPGGDTLTPKIQGLTGTGVAYDLIVGSASVAASTFLLHIGRGCPTTANVSASLPLPDAFQIVITASAAGSFTYSIEVNTCN